MSINYPLSVQNKQLIQSHCFHAYQGHKSTLANSSRARCIRIISPIAVMSTIQIQGAELNKLSNPTPGK
jgi:hypothetical protein